MQKLLIMNYKEMLSAAKSAGISSEKVMLASVDALNEMLEIMKEEHPDEYWEFMRKQHCIMYDHHYSREFAEHDADNMYHIEDGKKVSGPHWTKEQTDSVLNANRNKIPTQNNPWDFYVALNAQYHDYAASMKKRHPNDYEDEIICDAIAFWFNDEDYGRDGKIWDYMSLKY